MSTILLRTDRRGPATSRDDGITSNPVGVAIAGTGELGRIVPTAATMSSQIVESLRTRLDALEKEALAAWQKERQQHALDDNVSLTRTYRDRNHEGRSPFGLQTTERPLNGRYYHFLAGTKLYTLGLAHHPECKLNVSFEGVLVTRADGRVISAQVSVSPYDGYCGSPASWIEPLASLRLGNRLFWICRFSVEDGYNFGLFDPDANQIVEAKGRWGTEAVSR